MESTNRKKVLCPLERNGKTFWMRLGTAFTNKDGSLNVYLDAFPTDRKLQIRDLDARDLQPRRREADDGGALGGLPFRERDSDSTPF